MASQPSTFEHVLDQLSDIPGISAPKMFGEYGTYWGGKIVALVCDDQLFVKPTEPGRALVAGAIEAPPYPGARPSLLIDANRWDNTTWLVQLIRATADALPEPKPKQPKRL